MNKINQSIMESLNSDRNKVFTKILTEANSSNPNPGLDELIDFVKGLGWSCYVEDNGIEFSQYSPLGEDFSFYAEGTTPEEDGPAKVITCNYEGEEVNVIWEKSHVTFKINKNNKVLTREDVREYQFDQVNIDEYINNKTLATISKVLNGINGIESSLVPINENEHTYRFSTTFDFKTLNLDDLYNFYYRRFFNNGDINMTREQFDARYKSLDYDAMVKAYLNTGYICS